MKFCVLTLLFALASVASAQSPAQYRGFWLDTFNTALNTRADVVAAVNAVKLARCNAIFAQVRRRGDAWYLNSLEPIADRVPIAPGFDPLAELIAEAHANNIEVHAFVIIGAIWNGNPTGASARPPENANHVFNRHGFNQTTGKLYEGRGNWLTRTLLPDDANITFGGHRFGNDFWIDLGHPDAAEYTFRVLLHLVRNYDLDGLHLDRIRYPELSVAGQSPTAGVNIGYNETSVARFNRRYGTSGQPAPNDARWNDWRRAQVTGFVRRVYLNAILVKPNLKVSGALIAFGSGPASESEWTNAESYWRVFQDWRAWTQEGILDLAIPMNYKREHQASQAAAFDSWMEWTKNHAYDRAVLMGPGVYLNSIEGAIRQTRRSLAVNAQGNRALGTVFYSLANTNEAVTANPLSLPPGQNTPRRSLAEFAAGLTTGKSIDGSVMYDADAPPVFAATATIPVLPWKSAPQVGHLMGSAKTRSGEVVDAGEVLLARVADGTTPARGRTSVVTVTDGNGFFGCVDLAPGRYRVTVTPADEAPFAAGCEVVVLEGLVSNVELVIDRTASAVTSVSAAGYCGPTLAPDSIVAAFGASLAASTQVASSLPLPTELAGTNAKLRDSAGTERAVPLFFVSPGQVNYLLPPGTAPGPATLTVTNASGNAATGLVNVAWVAPALFAANADGRGVAAALALRVTAGGVQSFEPVAQFDAAQNRFIARPLDLGPDLGNASDQVFLILFGTGVRGHSELNQVRARIGGRAAEVSYAGAQGGLIGLDQINVRVPRSLGGRGEVEVVLTVDGFVSNVVRVGIK